MQRHPSSLVSPWAVQLVEEEKRVQQFSLQISNYSSHDPGLLLNIYNPQSFASLSARHRLSQVQFDSNFVRWAMTIFFEWKRLPERPTAAHQNKVIGCRQYIGLIKSIKQGSNCYQVKLSTSPCVIFTLIPMYINKLSHDLLFHSIEKGERLQAFSIVRK